MCRWRTLQSDNFTEPWWSGKYNELDDHFRLKSFLYKILFGIRKNHSLLLFGQLYPGCMGTISTLSLVKSSKYVK